MSNKKSLTKELSKMIVGVFDHSMMIYTLPVITEVPKENPNKSVLFDNDFLNIPLIEGKNEYPYARKGTTKEALLLVVKNTLECSKFDRNKDELEALFLISKAYKLLTQ